MADSIAQHYKKSHFLKWLFFVLVTGLLAACAETENAVQRLSGPTMGTSWHVTYIESDAGPAASLVQAGIESELERVNASMSTYLPTSEISRLNDAAVGEAFSISQPFLEVLQAALGVGLQSKGAYDVTVGPLVRLWGFGPGEIVRSLPAAEEVERARGQLGQASLVVDEAGQSVTRAAPVELDFSSIAKGYAVDRVARYLASLGIADYMVEVGGEIRVAGHSPRGDLWRIAIEQPDGSAAIAAAVALDTMAVATSGDYRNYFEHQGQRYSHSIDPRTGYPVDHELVSVTVLHPSAMYADAWATALTVLGPVEGLAVAQEQGLAVYFISRQGDAYHPVYTSGFGSALIEPQQ